jgi:hypothetical protein
VKRPPKREGASCSSAPIPNLSELATDNSGHAKAQVCRHEATRTGTERLPDGFPHYARLTCALCGRSQKNRTLSPKQQAFVDRLCATYLEGKTP